MLRLSSPLHPFNVYARYYTLRVRVSRGMGGLSCNIEGLEAAAGAGEPEI